jgi:CheY-like chemotaxis protein
MALVLVVDDEMSFRFFLKALFETEGHEVLIGRNAGEGIEHLKKRRPDLITLDVMMPGHGGLEMYRALNGESEWRDIPVIMLSGVRAETYAHALAMSDAGGESLPEPFAYIEKPPHPERLLEIARPVLERRGKERRMKCDPGVR